MTAQGSRTKAVVILSSCGVSVMVCGLLFLGLPLMAQEKSAPPAKEQASKALEELKLTNPGFEAGERTVQGWNQGAALEGVEYRWERKVGHDGTSSVAIRKSSPRYFPIAAWTQSVAHTGKSSKLRLSAYVKADKAQKAILDVEFKTAEETTHQWAAYIGAKTPSDPPADHDWKLYSGVVAIPKGTTELTIGLQDYGPGAVWFDDVKAEYVPDDTPAGL